MVNVIETIKTPKIEFKSLVIGIVIFTVIASIGLYTNISVLFAVSALGLIYTGFYAKDIVWGVILGAVGTIPLIIISIFTKILPFATMNEMMILIIGLLITGAIVGALGTYVKITREKNIAKAQIGKKKKNKKN